jgi:hypothetical protein
MQKFALIGVYTLTLGMGSASAQYIGGNDPFRAIDRALAEQQRLNDQWRVERQLRERQWDLERRMDNLEFRQRLDEADSDWWNGEQQRRR